MIPKGTKPEWQHPLTKEDCIKGAHAATKKRMENAQRRKDIAEIVRAILDEPAQDGKPMTRAEAIARRALKNAYERGTLKDLETLQKLLGEAVTKVDVSGSGVNIVVNSPDEAKKLTDILGE